jgi:hypothetical protein
MNSFRSRRYSYKNILSLESIKIERTPVLAYDNFYFQECQKRSEAYSSMFLTQLDSQQSCAEQCIVSDPAAIPIKRYYP